LTLKLKEKIIITGGSGHIASALGALLEQLGKYDVHYLSRNKRTEKDYIWDPEIRYIDPKAIPGTTHLIHLAGTSIADKRWTKSVKKEIITSRVNTANWLYQLIEEQHIPLKTFISASAIGYYGGCRREDIVNEDTPAYNDFMGTVCEQWEAAANQFLKLNSRVVTVRIGVVLFKQGGALHKMVQTSRWGFVPIGDGKQPISWIHLHDLCAIFKESLLNIHMQGAYNAVSPHFVDNQTLTQALAKQLNKPYWNIGIPAFLLRIILGERAILVTNGVIVEPKRLIENGFKFKYAHINDALANIYS